MLCFALPPSGNAVPASFLLEGGSGDFRAAFAAHSGFPARRILFTASGASALYLALRGLAILEPGKRAVAVPAWCCPSVPQTVLQAGLEPVLVDVDPATLSYDPASLDQARGRKPLAVVVVHFFGMPQPLPPGDWAGAAFLRDCAQDFDHRRDPEDAAAACFYSFGRGKALNSGHGGALCLPGDGPLADACLRILAGLPASREKPLAKALAINLLSRPRLFWFLSALPFLGIGATAWNAPLAFAGIAPGFPPLGSACLEAYLQRREYYRGLTARYRSLLASCDAGKAFHPGPGAGHAGLPTRFPVLVRDRALRETLFREANRRFGGVTRMYPEPLDRIAGAPAGLGGGREYPGARRLAAEILTLPVTAELLGREKGYLDCLAGILERKGALQARFRPIPGPDPPSSLPSGP